VLFPVDAEAALTAVAAVGHQQPDPLVERQGPVERDLQRVALTCEIERARRVVGVTAVMGQNHGVDAQGAVGVERDRHQPVCGCPQLHLHRARDHLEHWVEVQVELVVEHVDGRGRLVGRPVLCRVPALQGRLAHHLSLGVALEAVV